MLLSFSLALKSLTKNKGRTILTVLGIVIGITAVIAVMSTGQAIKSLIVGEVEKFGTNYIEIEVKTPQTSQTSSENAFSLIGGAMVTTLTDADAQEVAKHPNVARYYSGVMGQEIISYKNEIKKAMLFGTTEKFIDIDSSEVAFGRFYTDEESDSLSQVAVIGPKIAEKLFGQNDPLGKNIKIGKLNFRVIGVLKERGASFMFDMDNMVFLPLKTLQKKLLGIEHVSFIFTQLKDTSLSAQTKADIEAILRDRHDITDPNKDDFAVTTMDEAMEMMEIIINAIQFLLLVLGSISLIVGGVGIMNIMYVSVTERTYEIGLRKAIGAKNSHILWQFLWEAIILTLIGGIIGIILGIGISYLISVIATNSGFKWNFSISWVGLVLAVSMSTIVGLTFGLYPAKKAANLDPIVALRKE